MKMEDKYIGMAEEAFREMKEADKYFTPSIEDIRVGYECEVEQYNPLTKKMDWVMFNVNSSYLARGYSESTFDYEQLRTPYLTKEQIETEGWKSTGRSVDLWFEKEGDFEIGSWTSYKIRIHYGAKEHIGNKDCRLYIDAIDRGEEHKLFEGECKDINTFRYICKLLNIK